MIGDIGIGRLFVQHSHALQYQSVCSIFGQFMQDAVAKIFLKLLLGLACTHLCAIASKGTPGITAQATCWNAGSAINSSKPEVILRHDKGGFLQIP